MKCIDSVARALTSDQLSKPSHRCYVHHYVMNSTTPLAERLSQTITHAVELFKDMAEQQWTHKPNPDKWSKKEILGHLVDSAINNLQRFTESQYTTPLKVRPYQQDALVQANKYQSQDIDAILTLWIALNGQIVYVIKNIKLPQLKVPVMVPDGQKKDLEWLIDDYIVHLIHHLKQILGVA